MTPVGLPGCRRLDWLERSRKEPATIRRLLSSDSGVVRVRQRCPEWLVAAVGDDQQRLVDALGLVVKQAEQPIVMPAGTVDTKLEPARHLPLHRLPVAATGESPRRRRCDGDGSGAHRRPHLRRLRVERPTARLGHRWVVGAVALEVVRRRRAGHPARNQSEPQPARAAASCASGDHAGRGSSKCILADTTDDS